MSTVFFSDTDHMNADGTMTILRCASCEGRLRIRPACSYGYRHVGEDGHLGRTDCDQYPQAMPSRVVIPLASGEIAKRKNDENDAQTATRAARQDRMDAALVRAYEARMGTSKTTLQEREFVAHHDGDAQVTKRLRVLGEWCRRFAAQNTDPDAINSLDFNTQLLAIWRASGEAIAQSEDATGTR